MKNTFKLLFATFMIALCVGVYSYAGANHLSVIDTVLELQSAGIIVTAVPGMQRQQINAGAPAQAARVPGTPNGSTAGVINPGDPVYMKPMIPSAKVTITSSPDAAAVQTQIFIWNQDYLQDTATNGGVALVYNFEDAFTGNLTSRMIGEANSGDGQVLYGIYIRALADGVADPTGLSNTEPSILKYTGRGTNAVPTELYIDDNETRADQDDSIGVVRIPGGLPFDRKSQFTCFINGDAAVTYTLILKFYFYPNFKV